MISRAHRFHGHNSLNFVYRHGQTVRRPDCLLKYALNPRRTSYRAAVVVSRKVHKSAVVRNRIRRRIYEVIRLNQAQITKPHDLVFVVLNQQIIDLPAKQLNQMITGQLKQAGVLAGSRPARSQKPGSARDIVETNG
jgi:ribonuclease P protein component